MIKAYSNLIIQYNTSTVPSERDIIEKIIKYTNNMLDWINIVMDVSLNENFAQDTTYRIRITISKFNINKLDEIYNLIKNNIKAILKIRRSRFSFYLIFSIIIFIILVLILLYNIFI